MFIYIVWEDIALIKTIYPTYRKQFDFGYSSIIKEVVNVNFPRPRMSNSEVKTSKEYAELRDHIWNLVKDEASQTNRGE